MANPHTTITLPIPYKDLPEIMRQAIEASAGDYIRIHNVDFVIIGRNETAKDEATVSIMYFG